MNTREIIIKHEYENTKLILAIATIFAIIFSIGLSYTDRVIGPGYKFHFDLFLTVFISLEVIIFMIIKIPEFMVPSNSEVKIKIDSDESGIVLEHNFFKLELERGEIFSILFSNGRRSSISRVIIKNSRNQELEFSTTKSNSDIRDVILDGLKKDNNIRLVKENFLSTKTSYRLENLIEIPSQL